MKAVFNATAEERQVQCRGSWFTFKPKQIKIMDEGMAKFVGTDRRYPGILMLSDKFEEPEYRLTDEGKAELEQAEEEGITHFVEHLRQRVYNNQVSLRLDLEKANLKVDPAVLATAGELEAMQLLVKYQKTSDDKAQKQVDKVKDLMKTIGPMK